MISNSCFGLSHSSQETAWVLLSCSPQNSSQSLHVPMILQSTFPTTAPSSVFVFDSAEAPNPNLLLLVSLVHSSSDVESQPAILRPASQSHSPLRISLPLHRVDYSPASSCPCYSPPSSSPVPSPRVSHSCLACRSPLVSILRPQSPTRLTSSTPPPSLPPPCPSPSPRAVYARPPQKRQS